MSEASEPLDWTRIEDIFHRVLELPEGDREHALMEACGEEPAVLGEVKALLAASTGAAHWVDNTIEDAVGDWFETHAATEDGMVPETLGPFHILKRLSEGGSSVVYLAERRQPYRQQVAIKLLKRGMDTDEILRRLKLEGQILAQLEHPNIARLLDGGSTPDGRPYFALEYIDGEPIDQYCDSQGLGVAERLRLFRQACAAVHAAHRRLIIHRDLKPSNLLVTRDGEPKLLDFGIAKLLDTSTVDASVAWTRPGTRWMTPEYAAPEQLLGQPLTTAVDTYALGVMLYQLLTGELPFDGERRHTGALEIDPLDRPSTRISRGLSDASAALQVARRRGTTPDRLVKAVRGDLDTIVGKAMHLDPERRYGSVQQLAEDIDRHLRSEPVLARPDTWTYRCVKFVRRHRTGVLALLGTFVVLLAAVIGTTRAMRVAERQQSLAEQRLGELEAVVDFTTGMFEIADPGESHGSEVTVREILDRGATRIDEEMAEQPAIAARLMATMGRVYQNLGLYPSAHRLLDEAAGRWAMADGGIVHGQERIDVLQQLVSVSIDRGLFDEADGLLEEIRTLEERHGWTSPHPSLATTLHLSALVARQLEDDAAAEAPLRRALAMRLELIDEDPLAVAESRNDLGEVLVALGRFEEAEGEYRQALTVRQARLGDEHPQVAETLHNLATVLERRGAFGAAETELRRILEIRRGVLGPDHRDVAVSLNNLGRVLSAQDRHDEAAEALRQALGIARSALGDHPATATILNNLGLELRSLGQLDEAMATIRESLEIKRTLFGDPSEPLVIAQFNWAMLLATDGRRREAIRVLRNNLTAMETLGIADARLAYPLTLLAEQLALEGRCDASSPLAQRAMELRRDLPDESRIRGRTEEVVSLCPP